MEDAEFWRNLEKCFGELAKEEYRELPHPAHSQRLRAYGDYTDEQAQGIGRWRLNDGLSADFHARFEETATWAGVALSPPQGANPLQFWLHSLYDFVLELDERRSDRGHLAVGDRGGTGIVRDICQVSATYCSRLVKEALEHNVATGIQRSESVAGQDARGKAGPRVQTGIGSAPVNEPTELSRTTLYIKRNQRRRNPRYANIDMQLIKIAEMRPRSHREVFVCLDERRIPLPYAKPFETARGWVAGFRQDPSRARAWLSKTWSGLNLPPFQRGPK